MTLKKEPMKSRATLKLLIDEAVSLSTNRYDYHKAIECLELGLIMCKNLELSLPPESFSSETSNKIDSILKHITTDDEEVLSSFTSPKVEPDEGLHFYTKTLATAEIDLERISFIAVEALITFNLGICFSLLSGLNEDAEAALYFSRAEKLLRGIERDKCDASECLDCPFQLVNIAILHNYGLLHIRAGRYEDALNCYFEAVGKSTIAYGPDDLSIAVAFNCIGVVFIHQSFKDELACDEAIEFLTRSFAIMANFEHHDDDIVFFDEYTGTVLNNIGRINFTQGHLEEALSFHEEAHKTRESLLGKFHIDTGVAAFNTGQCHHNLGRPKLALKYYALFVQSVFNSKQQGDEEPVLAEWIVLTLESIATRFHEECSFENAGTFYVLTLSSAEKVFGYDAIYVAQILNKLGNLQCECDKLDEALKSYKRGLKTERATYPLCDGTNIATTLSNIARVHEHNNCLKEALSFYEQSFKTLSESNDATVDGIAAVGWKIACLQENMGQTDLAIRTFSHILDFLREEKGHDHSDLQIILNRIGKLCMKKGFFQEALSSYKDSILIRQLEGSPFNIESTKLLNIACCRFQDGYTEENLACFKNDVVKVLIVEGGDTMCHPPEVEALVALTKITSLNKKFQPGKTKSILDPITKAGNNVSLLPQ